MPRDHEELRSLDLERVAAVESTHVDDARLAHRHPPMKPILALLLSAPSPTTPAQAFRHR